MLSAKRDSQSGKRRWSWWTADFQASLDKAKVGDRVTLADFNKRIMEPTLEAAAEACRNDMIDAMIAQLQAFRNVVPDEKQRKHLAKASKQLRKMGWPKTAIDAATWRKLHPGVELAPNEMTWREADERNDVHLAKGMTP